jgi:hypothetical protein
LLIDIRQQLFLFNFDLICLIGIKLIFRLLHDSIVLFIKLLLLIYFLTHLDKFVPRHGRVESWILVIILAGDFRNVLQLVFVRWIETADYINESDKNKQEACPWCPAHY